MRVAERVAVAQTTPCPCHRFRSTTDVFQALQSEDTTNEMIDWLSGRMEHKQYQSNIQGSQRLSCKSSDRCDYRLNASFLILNEIRNACRDYLEGANRTELDTSSVTYEESFPPLSLNNSNSAQSASIPSILIARKKPNTSKNTEVNSVMASTQAKPLRRIRPGAALASTEVGNIARLPSEKPLPLDTLPTKTDDATLKGSLSTTVSHGKGSISKSHSSTLTSTSIKSMSCTTGSSSTFFPFKTLVTNDGISNLQKQRNGSTALPPRPLSNAKGILTMAEGDPSPASSFSTSIQPTHPSFSSVVKPSDSFSKTGSVTSLLMPQTPSNNRPILTTMIEKRLAKLYSSLIEYSLVPSTPLELHFLVGLLTIEDSAVRKPKQNAICDVFTSPKACRNFAMESLSNLRTLLANLHLQVLSGFVDCPPVLELLPDLTAELSARLRKRQDVLLERETVFGGGMQPILTRPFDENRDSRHKFKARGEGLLYRNREESRDAFLYQLRFFQNMRGRVLDTAELELSLLKIKRAAGEVIRSVQAPNMHWFTQFFTDLLLQIGLVPMEETDQELLKIADKEKLQRLHKRFSAKVATSKGTSIKVLSDIKDDESPEREANQFFPGHQEFFFLFIQAGDCYSFGMHLKSRLIANIKSLESFPDMKGVQDRIMKLQLLAKFLGLLLFSPTWHANALSGVLNSMSSEEIAIWTNATELVLLPLENLVDQATTKKRLLYTIPWILELLRMAKWDVISMRSVRLQSIFNKLISLRDAIRARQTPSLQLVYLSLESFFHEVVGLRQTHAVLPRHDLAVPMTSEDGISPDDVELQLSKTFLFASVSHMDDLLSLLTSIVTTKGKSVGTPRKMRPSIVSASITSFPTLSNHDGIAPIAPMTQSVLSSSSVDGKSLIIRKLVDLFFHQHSDLKEIGEFVADRAVTKAMNNVQQHFLEDYFGKLDLASLTDDQSYQRSEVEQVAQTAAQQCFETSLCSAISEAINLLSLPSTAARVKDIAINLTFDHAKTSSSTKVTTMINLEVKKCYEACLTREKKELVAVSSGVS